MSSSHSCLESLRNSKDNSLWYVARDATLWVPATQSKGMHVNRTFCGIRSGPNVTTGVVSMQRSHTSDLVRFSWQMLRRWLTKSSWKYDDAQNASTDRRPWKCYGWLRCQNPGQPRSNWKVWDKEEKQLHLALEWSMIGERSGLERRWRYQGSQMITKSMTRLWRSIRMWRAVCAQCKTWSSLWRTTAWRWEFQRSGHVSIVSSREWRWPSTWKSFRKSVEWSNYDVKHHSSRIPHFRLVVEWKQDLCLRKILRSDLSGKQWRVPGASPRCCVGTHAQEYTEMIECRASELHVPVLSMRSKLEVRSCCERLQNVVKGYGSITWTGIPWTRHRLFAHDKRSRQESLTRRQFIVERGRLMKMMDIGWVYVHGKFYGQRFGLKFHFSERCDVGQDDRVRRAVVSLGVLKNECSFRL